MNAIIDDDVTFHLLDIQSRDMRVESEDENIRECVYESNDEMSDDEEFGNSKRKKKKQPFSKHQRELVIHLFGSTETGKPVRVDVTGFRPTIYLRLPENNMNRAVDSIRKYLSTQEIDFNSLTFKKVNRKIFYGFTANTYYPFLEITMPSLGLFRAVRNLFLDEHLNPMTKEPLEGVLRGKMIEVYEANIDPMLRFLHVQNIKPCGWVKIVGGKDLIDDIDGNEWVISCSYEDVQPSSNNLVSAPFLTASWDIECLSLTGDFPLAIKNWKKTAKECLTIASNSIEVANLITKSISTNERLPEDLPKGMTPIYCEVKGQMQNISLKLLTPRVQEAIEECMNHKKEDMDEKIQLLEKVLDKNLKGLIKLIGDPVIQIGTRLTRGVNEGNERHLFVYPDCAPIEGIIIHSYKTEKAMILGWFDWIIKINPDILIGYNVFGFDEKYVWQRAEELGIIGSNSIIHPMTRLFDLGDEVKLKDTFLSSSALGDNWLYIWTTNGRLQIDLYHYIRRNAVLPSYKLDEVTKYYMSGKLKKYNYDNDAKVLTIEVGGAVQDVKAGRAITLIDETGETVSEKLIVNTVSGSSITFNCDLDEDALRELEDATKWVIVKDDVSPQDIFRLHRESAEGRAIVGKYCLQDCDLVIDLYRKLETFNNSMSMANVCTVPVSYIFTRGQGIKIESLIFKACSEREILIPVLPSPKEGSGDSYEGAIVLDPVPGFYATSPIGVCDFASLYPSTIVSENISHDSLVWVKDFTEDGTLIAHNWGCEDFDDCEGYAYTDIEYDIWRPDPNDTRKNPVKIKCGRRICRYAQPLDGSKSTLPQITLWLLAAREAKKKEMKSEKNPERYALLDAEQLAYKLTGNSLYGQLGSSTFKIRLQALAASVTAYGRKQILFAKEAIEKFYGPGANNPKCAASCMAKVVYGDSVTGDTPLILKNKSNNKIFLKRIDELYNNDEWNKYHDTKEAIDLDNNDLLVWTDKGFTKIKKIIRHKLAPNKKLFRINTHTGVVDATEDHSLVLKDGTEVKPNDIKIGTELLHNDNLCNEFNSKIENYQITENEAFVMGLFVADGSSDVYETKSGKKATWAINKLDMGLLVTAMEKAPFETKILNTVESSGVFKLIPVGDLMGPAKKYRELFYNEHREKRIPDVILNAPLNVIKHFWDGFYSGDGDKDENGYIRFDQKGKEIGAGLYILGRRLGYNVSVNERATKENVFRYTMTNSNQRKNPIAIKKIRELSHPGDVFVYDLETENHHFGVGPGALIVHNTDSLFVQFNVKNSETGELLQGREARQATIEITDEAGAFITKALKAPHDFEFDKAFDPMLMFSKKRYAGNMYENNADDYVHKYMGIALKRRDNAPIVKTIFGGAMKMLLNNRDVAGAYKFVKDSCLELVDGKVNLGQLTITKSLRADYADPSRIAHKALADRIAQRDPGNAPAAGDRIGYVHIATKPGKEVSKLQGDRIETPQFIKENNLKPDFRHYIEHQLQNPISQMFGILLEQIPGFHHDMLRSCPIDPEKAISFREQKAADLLFSECLQRFDAANRRVAMSNFFGVKTELKPVVSTIKTRSNTSIPSENQNTTHVSKPKPVQKTISSFLYDSYIVETMNKKKREATAAAKKKAKETTANT